MNRCHSWIWVIGLHYAAHPLSDSTERIILDTHYYTAAMNGVARYAASLRRHSAYRRAHDPEYAERFRPLTTDPNI